MDLQSLTEDDDDHLTTFSPHDLGLHTRLLLLRVSFWSSEETEAGLSGCGLVPG